MRTHKSSPHPHPHRPHPQPHSHTPTHTRTQHTHTHTHTHTRTHTHTHTHTHARKSSTTPSLPAGCILNELDFPTGQRLRLGRGNLRTSPLATRDANPEKCIERPFQSLITLAPFATRSRHAQHFYETHPRLPFNPSTQPPKFPPPPNPTPWAQASPPGKHRRPVGRSVRRGLRGEHGRGDRRPGQRALGRAAAALGGAQLPPRPTESSVQLGIRGTGHREHEVPHGKSARLCNRIVGFGGVWFGGGMATGLWLGGYG